MTSPSAADRPVLRIHDRADLIATIPALLGFTPTDSAVIIGTTGNHIAALARIDLTDVDDLAPQLHQHRPLDPARAVEIVIIAADTPPAATPPTSDDPGRTVTTHQEPIDVRMPYAPQVALLTNGLTTAGYEVTHASWTPAIRAGQTWRCYHRRSCCGILPDPRSTVVAVAATISGRVTYSSRAALADTLRPDPDDVLEHRAALIAARETTTAAGIDLVRAAVARAQAGRLPATDTDIASLAAALANPAVRDTSIRYSLQPTNRAAHQLWTTLVRASPAPHRAAPAILLAVTAYLDGDGTLATIATQAALDAHPSHPLAETILVAIRTGLPPAQLRAATTKLFDADGPNQPGPPPTPRVTTTLSGRHSWRARSRTSLGGSSRRQAAPSARREWTARRSAHRGRGKRR
jgi:Domain of unknown function (DUF4192)